MGGRACDRNDGSIAEKLLGDDAELTDTGHSSAVQPEKVCPAKAPSIRSPTSSRFGIDLERYLQNRSRRR